MRWKLICHVYLWSEFSRTLFGSFTIFRCLNDFDHIRLLVKTISKLLTYLKTVRYHYDTVGKLKTIADSKLKY